MKQNEILEGVEYEGHARHNRIVKDISPDRKWVHYTWPGKPLRRCSLTTFAAWAIRPIRRRPVPIYPQPPKHFRRLPKPSRMEHVPLDGTWVFALHRAGVAGYKGFYRDGDGAIVCRYGEGTLPVEDFICWWPTQEAAEE